MGSNLSKSRNQANTTSSKDSSLSASSSYRSRQHRQKTESSVTSTSSTFQNQPHFQKEDLGKSRVEYPRKNGINTALNECSSMHYVIKELFNGNFNSPVNDILEAGDAKVLEVGCSSGNGIWTINMAQDYPLSFFIGIDPNAPTNACQPDNGPISKPIPSNIRFDRCDDIFTSLPYADDEYDFVYVKMMGIVVPGGDQAWKRFIEELCRVTKSGGYIEIMDPDYMAYNAGPNYDLLVNRFKEVIASHGISMHNGNFLRKLLDNTPQVMDVRWGYVSVPMVTKVMETMRLMILSLEPLLRDSLGLIKRPDNREYEIFTDACIKECLERELFYNMHYAYAVKI